MTPILAASIAMRIHEARETVRRLYGKDYDAKMVKPRAFVRLVMAELKVPALEVPLVLDRRGGLNGFAAVFIIAAVADEVEA